MNQRLVDFYTSDGTDSSGRTYDEIMAFDDGKLESVHDYIQWLFPTEQASKAQPNPPTLDAETIKALKNNPTFRARYHKALVRIFAFWGIPLVQTSEAWFNFGPILSWADWMNYGDHNQLRIARVLESTRLLGFSNTSDKFFMALLKFCTTRLADDITAANVAFWYQAATGNKII